MVAVASSSIALLLLASNSQSFTARPSFSTKSSNNYVSSVLVSSSKVALQSDRVIRGAATAAAVSNDEDVELTRRVIMSHVAATSTMNDDVNDDEDDDSTTTNDSGYPTNDLMIRAALGQSPVERTPVWLFRQAGRHLPEYREYKTKVQRSFLDMLSYPEDVAECTLQPVRRYNVDAAILFSDILVIAEAMNVEVTMPGGVGIQIPCPLVGPADMKERLPKLLLNAAAVDEENGITTTSTTREFVKYKLGHVMESIRLIRSKMTTENISIPLIGFSAAPWTLLFYMVGGSSKKNQHVGMDWLHTHPTSSQDLLDMLTDIVIEYMSLQIENGAHMLQLFEAMGMMINPAEFEQYALPCLRTIASELKRRHPNVPLMIFARGACYMNEQLSTMGYDVVTIDGSVNRATARSIVADRAGLQGNYEPGELIATNGKTVETVRQTARELLISLGPQRLIANLGEGLGGNESPELVAAFVDAIHEESERLISAAGGDGE